MKWIYVLCTIITSFRSTVGVVWPVFFENMGSVHSIHNKWDLNLKFNTGLNDLENQLSSKEVALKDLKYRFSEEFLPELRSSDSKSRLYELEDLLTEQNLFLKLQISGMKEKIEKIRGFAKNSRSRAKRQNFAGLGSGAGVLQSLFGVAYTNDVSDMDSKLDVVKQQLRSDIDRVRNLQNSIRQEAMSRIDLQTGEIKKVENMTEMLGEKVTNMETNPLIKSPLGDFLHEKSIAYQKIEQEVFSLKIRLNGLERSILSLTTNRLNENILPPRKLLKILSRIKSQLPKNYTLLFDPFSKNGSIWPYYSYLSIISVPSKDMEYFTLSLTVPLLDSSNVLDLNRVHNLPLKVQDGYSVTADISTEYLVTDSDKQYYLELRKEDFQDCQVYVIDTQQHFYCGLYPMLRSDSSYSCVIELLRGNGDSVLCQSKLKSGLIQPFTRLYNGSWIFAALNGAIPITLRCPDGETLGNLVGFGVIHLSSGCSMFSKEYFYPHTFSNSSELDLSEKIDYVGETGKEESYEEYDVRPTDEEPKFPPFTGVFEPELISAVVLESENETEEQRPTFDEFLVSLSAKNGSSSIAGVEVQDSGVEDTTIHHDILVKLKNSNESRNSDHWFFKLLK